MPIFEYRCSDCGEKFEELVLSRDAEAVTCSSCESSAVERLFSTFAAQTSSNGSDCYSKSAGICQAGGGRVP